MGIAPISAPQSGLGEGKELIARQDNRRDAMAWVTIGACSLATCAWYAVCCEESLGFVETTSKDGAEAARPMLG